jgi:predicted helicase
MYTLAILSSPLYRSRFSESLEQDHPHIPFPRYKDVFARMAEWGRLLAAAHLLEATIDEGVRFAADVIPA